MKIEYSTDILRKKKLNALGSILESKCPNYKYNYYFDCMEMSIKRSGFMGGTNSVDIQYNLKGKCYYVELREYEFKYPVIKSMLLKIDCWCEGELIVHLTNI